MAKIYTSMANERITVFCLVLKSSQNTYEFVNRFDDTLQLHSDPGTRRGCKIRVIFVFSRIAD